MSDTPLDEAKFLAKEYVSLWKTYGIEGLKGDLNVEMESTTTEDGVALRARHDEQMPKVPCPAPRSGDRPTLEDIRKRLGQGCGCTLCPTRKNLVFGTGNPNAELMFVGEGPGADEDAQGLPFVGRAGQLLNKIIEAMGYKREDVYIANVVKCRPPQNRQPLPEEIAACSPYLREQIEAVNPKVVVALGATASGALVENDGPLSNVRGKFQKLCWNPEVPVLPTYHPAYLLRNPPAKKIVWEDMKVVMTKLGKSVEAQS